MAVDVGEPGPPRPGEELDPDRLAEYLRLAFGRKCGHGLQHEARNGVIAACGGPGAPFPSARFEREEIL